MEIGKKYGIVSHCWELSVLQQDQARDTEEVTYLRMNKFLDLLKYRASLKLTAMDRTCAIRKQTLVATPTSILTPQTYPTSISTLHINSLPHLITSL